MDTIDVSGLLPEQIEFVQALVEFLRRRRLKARQVILEFPINLPVEKIDEKIIKKTKEVFVLELLREGEISQGKAAELLEMNRHDLFDLMAEHDIPAINMTEEELKEELSKEISKPEDTEE